MGSRAFEKSAGGWAKAFKTAVTVVAMITRGPLWVLLQAPLLLLEVGLRILLSCLRWWLSPPLPSHEILLLIDLIDLVCLISIPARTIRLFESTLKFYCSATLSNFSKMLFLLMASGGHFRIVYELGRARTRTFSKLGILPSI